MVLHERLFRYDTALIQPDEQRGEFAMKFGQVLYSYHLKNVPQFVTELVHSTLPVTVRWVEIDSDDVVKAHTDFLITCSLNIYVNASNCSTKFWQTIDRSLKPTERFFPFHELELLSEFEAQAGEAHLLNVATLHSVHSLNADSPSVARRSMVRLGWNIPPEEVRTKINNWVAENAARHKILAN